MSEPVILFENVYKSYPLYHAVTGGIKKFLFNLPKSLHQMKNSRFEALRNISFEVYRGETFGIIGKNGEGKSTILGIIAGVIKPDRGIVKVNGRVLSLLELGAGFHPELTGRENIILNGVLMGYSEQYIKNKMEEIIEFSELEDFVDQPIRIYSAGMLARLGFSVIASLEPEILLVDEIISVGDIGFQAKCFKKIKEFKEKGVTIVMVSHSMENIKTLCDRAIWLENHTVKASGKAEDVVKEFINLYKPKT